MLNRKSWNKLASSRESQPKWVLKLICALNSENSKDKSVLGPTALNKIPARIFAPNETGEFYYRILTVS